MRATLQQFEPGGDISQWRQGKVGDWDVLGNGFPSPTGLALTIMQGMYAGTAEKEATRDTYHGYIFPEITDRSPGPPRRPTPWPACRTPRGRATPDLGHVPVPVGVRSQGGSRAPAHASTVSRCAPRTPTTSVLRRCVPRRDVTATDNSPAPVHALETQMTTPSSATDTRLPDGVVRDVAEAGRRDALLPAPQVQNHAANLTVLPDGSLGCVWFAGTQEGVPDISVWFSRLARDRTMVEPVQLSDDPTRSEQNPVLYVHEYGNRVAAVDVPARRQSGHRAGHATRVRGRRPNVGRVAYTAAGDRAGGVFVRQPVVALATGRLLLPVFHCVRTGAASGSAIATTAA